MADVPQTITPGIIAQQIGVPLHRVIRVLDTRPHIQPLARTGRIRLYGREAIAMVRHELHAIDARRGEAVGHD